MLFALSFLLLVSLCVCVFSGRQSVKRDGLVQMCASFPIACMHVATVTRSPVSPSCSWSSSSLPDRQSQYTSKSRRCTFPELQCLSLAPARHSSPIPFLLPPSAPCLPLLPNVRTRRRPEVRGGLVLCSRRPIVLDLSRLDRAPCLRTSFNFPVCSEVCAREW